jgi:hypothetical protein
MSEEMGLDAGAGRAAGLGGGAANMDTGAGGPAGLDGGAAGMDPGAGGAASMDARNAMIIVQEAQQRAQRELRVRRPVLYLIWGLVVLVSYGAMWLSVRGQQPYRGAAWQALLLAFLLLVAAGGATANVVDTAASGVGGRSEWRRGIFVLSLVAGFAALESEKQALWYAGASRPVVALFGEAIPLLAAGLIFVMSSASPARLDWPRLALGLWLLAVASAGAWTGPVTNLAVCALAGGGGILLMAAIEPRLRRP